MSRWNEEGLRAVLLALSLIGAAGCGEAFAGPPRGKDYPRGAASAAASEMTPEPEAALVDGHKPWAPTFDFVLPDTVSDPPDKDAWAAAPIATEVRLTDPRCKARRLREWYRLECSGFGLYLELISGTREGVSFGCRKDGRESDFCDDVWVIFPARRGDRRALELLRFAKWGLDPDAIATEQFLEGDPCPLISMQGIRWGF